MNYYHHKNLWSHPGLYTLLAQIKETFKKDKHFARKRIISEKTDIVIEGFPRCANTYFTFKFLLNNPELYVSHHYHSPTQIIEASRKRIPSITLIRKPADAVSSLFTRDQKNNAEKLFILYREFYLPLSNACIETAIIDFENATLNFDESIKKANHLFNKNYNYGSSTDADVFKLIESRNSFHNNGSIDEAKIARPSIAREAGKKKQSKMILDAVSPTLILECNEIYTSLTKKAI